MDVAFPWPATQGEWLAWSAAALTVIFGLILLFAPRLSFRILRLQPVPAHPEALAEARARMAGFHLGVGFSCILLGPSRPLPGARLFMAVHGVRARRLDAVGPRQYVLQLDRPAGRTGPRGAAALLCFRPPPVIRRERPERRPTACDKSVETLAGQRVAVSGSVC